MIKVILVNEKDEIIGEEEKIKAHELGLLHRAFSIFLINSKGQILIQKRALNKYHSGGLLSNSCCSHPYINETEKESLKRCLKDELNIIDEIDLKEIGSFIYKSIYKENTEHEIDHVYIGYTDIKDINFNKEEIEELYWMNDDEITTHLNNNEFTSWFEKAYAIIKEYLKK